MRLGYRHILMLLMAALALEAAGCHNGLKWPSFGGHKEQSQDLRVEQRVGGQAVSLKAPEIVGALRRIGIPDNQIPDIGANLHDALRATGAAAIIRGGQTEVVLVVSEDHLFVQSRSQGSFIYDLKDKRFIAVPPMPKEN